jgi:hypothetical protein
MIRGKEERERSDLRQFNPDHHHFETIRHDERRDIDGFLASPNSAGL